MAETTSITLLQRIRDRSDCEAWQCFDNTYRSFIEGFLRRNGLKEQDAADVCQEVMIIVDRNMQKFEHNGNKGAFRNWLRQVVQSQLGVFRRKLKRPNEPLLDELVDQLGKPNSALAAILDQEHDRAALAVVLQLLRQETSSKAHEVFRRCFIDGISAEQVAKEFGMTKNAVVVAKCKTLKKARELGSGLLDLM